MFAAKKTLLSFLGAFMTMEEAAAAMDISKRSAEGLWTYARAWLRQEIQKHSGE